MFFDLFKSKSNSGILPLISALILGIFFSIFIWGFSPFNLITGILILGKSISILFEFLIEMSLLSGIFVFISFGYNLFLWIFIWILSFTFFPNSSFNVIVGSFSV